MRYIRFAVEGVPVGYDRREARHGFLPEKVRQWRRDVAVAYMASDRLRDPDYRGKVIVSIRAIGAPADADNVAKCILDALTGVAYRDDCQVVGLAVKLSDRELGPGGRPRKAQYGAGVLVGIHFVEDDR